MLIKDLSFLNREVDFSYIERSFENKVLKMVSNSKFLVIGGAGSIGSAVVKEIFCRNPLKLHLVDINENNLAEVVRDLRSSYGYIEGEFKTFCIDVGSVEYDVFFESDGNYDYVLNLSAMKHVRSEKDQYTLMRMVDINILNTIKTIDQCAQKKVKKYFCVSTDKASNPSNLMGASKRIMELFLFSMSDKIDISTARFANVAYSDGSLLHGFIERINKKQPLVSPKAIKRFFISQRESGEICLMSCLFGENMDIFFPKLDSKNDLFLLEDVAKNFLIKNNLKPLIVSSEDEARRAISNTESGFWPLFLSNSDTTGEKLFEEFYSDSDHVDNKSFLNLGVIKNRANENKKNLKIFLDGITNLKTQKVWNKKDIVDLFFKVIPHFSYFDNGKYLDEKM